MFRIRFLSSLLLALGLWAVSLPAQVIDERIFQSPSREIALPMKADQIEVDSEGNLLLLNTEDGVVFKLLRRYEYDSVLSIGGKSNRIDGFLNPVKIEITNRQSLWVMDDVQRRLALLNTGFEITNSLSFLGFNLENAGQADDEILPISFSVNGAGEIFLLNQLNNKIYKANISGQLEQIFGGLDYGDGSLYDPVDIVSGINNLLYVSDTSAQEILAFDNFGTYQYSIPPGAPFPWKSMRIYEQYLVVSNAHHMQIINLTSDFARSLRFPEGLEVSDLAFDRGHLYLLSGDRVLLFPLKS